MKNDSNTVYPFTKVNDITESTDLELLFGTWYKFDGNLSILFEFKRLNWILIGCRINLI